MRGKAFGTVASPVQRVGGPAAAASALKLISTSVLIAPGTSSVTVPAGATEALAFVRGAGASGGNSSAGNKAGGGAAEEFTLLSVVPGQTFSATVGTGGAASSTGTSGTASSLQLPDGTTITAAPGQAAGIGGVASATGRSGSSSTTPNLAAGGQSGAFVHPGLGGAAAAGNPETGFPGMYGGGGGSGINANGGKGGNGTIIIIFKGPLA